MLRVFDAAALLGVNAVCGFVGRNQQHSMDENLVDFEQQFIPLLKAAKSRGLTYRVEQCPMPGWTTGDNWHNNIAYTPGAWIALHRICEKHGVGDQFRIHYDPSHAILMGQDTRSIFQYLEGHRLQLPDRRIPRQGAGHGLEGLCRRGAMAVRPSSAATGSKGSRRRIRPINSTRGRSRWCSPSTNCPAPRVTIRSPTCRTAPSIGWIISSPRASSCSSTSPDTHLVVEHEYPKARIQDKARLKPILQGSIAFVRHIDEAAGSMFALHEVLAAQGIPVQGVGRQAYRS